MTKEELEKATGQELIEQRDYCGVDGYYGDYLDNVNAEMLKRFNHLEELKLENEQIKNSDTLCKLIGEQKRKNNGLSDNLSKAKSLLAKWVELYKPKSETVLPTPIQIDTEQFLREVSE